MQNQENIEPPAFKKPTFALSALALGSVIVTLFVGVMYLKTISIHACLLLGIVFVCLISKTLGYKFSNLMDFMGQSIGNAAYGLWFFFAIGAIIASWMIAGTVPAVVYYGLGFITPQIFLPAGLLLCSIMALCIGTSWGTIGTVGVALIGIGEGIGMPLPITAAMIVSGATFGDKMSPVSDTPNLTSMATGSDVYSTIRAMAQTIAPAYILAFILFTLIGLQYGGGEANLENIMETRRVLAQHFIIHPIVLLPIVVLIALNIMKYPSLPAMAIVVAVALLVAIVVQGASLATAIETLNSGFKLETNSVAVNAIVNRGGLQAMLWTFSVAFLSLSLGGILDKCGYLVALIEGAVSKAKSVGSLSLLVMTTSIISTAGFGEPYLSIILNGNLYRKEFDTRGLNRSMLGRIVSEGALMLAPLMAWTTFGAFTAATLGISGGEFAMYAFLNILSPIISVLMAYLGIAVVWNNPKNKGVRKFADADLSNEPKRDDIMG